MTPLAAVGVVLISYALYLLARSHCRAPYEFFLLGWATAGLLALGFVDHALKLCGG